MSTTEDRRKFLKGAGVTLASLPFIGALFAPAVEAKPAAAPPVVPKVKPKALKIPDLKVKAGMSVNPPAKPTKSWKQEFAAGGVVRENANVAGHPMWRDRPYRTHVEFEVYADTPLAIMPGDVVAVELGGVSGAMCNGSEIQHVLVQEMTAHHGAYEEPSIDITGILVDKGHTPVQFFPKRSILRNTLRFEIEERVFRYDTIGGRSGTLT